MLVLRLEPCIRRCKITGVDAVTKKGRPKMVGPSDIPAAILSVVLYSTLDCHSHVLGYQVGQQLINLLRSLDLCITRVADIAFIT